MSSVTKSKTRQSTSEVEELDAFVGGSREDGGGFDELGGLVQASEIVEVVEVVDALMDEHVEELVDAHEAGAAACDLVSERF
jgi:hypothetical protein